MEHRPAISVNLLPTDFVQLCPQADHHRLGPRNIALDDRALTAVRPPSTHLNYPRTHRTIDARK
jgi:hypothetical protein